MLESRAKFTPNIKSISQPYGGPPINYDLVPGIVREFFVDSADFSSERSCETGFC